MEVATSTAVQVPSLSQLVVYLVVYLLYIGAVQALKWLTSSRFDPELVKALVPVFNIVIGALLGYLTGAGAVPGVAFGIFSGGLYDLIRTPSKINRAIS